MIHTSNRIQLILRKFSSLAVMSAVAISVNAISFTLDDLGKFPLANTAHAKNDKDDKDDKGDKADKGGKDHKDDKGDKSAKGDESGGKGSSKSAGSTSAPATVVPSPSVSVPLSESLNRALDVIQNLFGGQVGHDLSEDDEADLIRRGWTRPPSLPATVQ